ncbi:hypothetical protein [Microcoleus sp. FACHB-672]|uniref:hypothetical protein n=1 Tax=Microcoleus sp. FACHB-672 TaxID=2692825 RepID=UPI0016880A22|nr:hypothetical protein [Microcoleus sp. FACHB-672]MBD2040124.1 hypothetical protein [Microcoleus sp. FACHB-672]
MQAQATLPKISLDKIVERIMAFRQISRIDQRLLMSSLLSKDSLSEQDQSSINQVFDALQRGLLKVVD